MWTLFETMKELMECSPGTFIKVVPKEPRNRKSEQGMFIKSYTNNNHLGTPSRLKVLVNNQIHDWGTAITAWNFWWWKDG